MLPKATFQHVQQSYCKFTEAMDTLEETKQYIVKLTNVGHSLNLAGLYSEFSSLYSSRSQYKEAYEWAMEFKQAELLIKQALHMAWEHFGREHPKTADTLLDYGFYLLNQTLFQNARDHAEKAMQIMTRLLPEDHLLLASSKRVKALILEEIAIDNTDKEQEMRLLQEALDLHVSALRLSCQAFGEINIQTAKHYGNLGRLYQSMRRFKEAEEMHLKAIDIKERLLGPEDYEVALSVNHLASLQL
ncbi:hypothetical protein HPB49_026058 [Dermacentor silvarum]|nr:hypothetical protein HPB49_026058 [Dermacentor silvarum]